MLGLPYTLSSEGRLGLGLRCWALRDMDEEGLGEERVDHRDQGGAQEGKCQEMEDGRKTRRTLGMGGSSELNGFREPSGQRCPARSQRTDAAGELARKGVVFFLLSFFF